MKNVILLLTFTLIMSTIRGAESQAKGFYKDGQLVNGENILGRSETIHKIFLKRQRNYGTIELLDTINDLANEMHRRFGTIEKLQVGDLSHRKGGPASPQHSSHQNGLDADIVYLSKNHKLQDPNESKWTQYYSINSDISRKFNTHRNWEMFKYLVSRGNVSRILVDTVVKREICKYAKRIGEYKKHAETLRRMRALKKHHRTHFHLRIKCPKGDLSCIDQVEPPKGTACNL